MIFAYPFENVKIVFDVRTFAFLEVKNNWITFFEDRSINTKVYFFPYIIEKEKHFLERIEKGIFIFNAYFRFRHASVTNGAVVAESGGSIHGSSPFVLGEAAQYRTQGRRRFEKNRERKQRGWMNWIEHRPFLLSSSSKINNLKLQINLN